MDPTISDTSVTLMDIDLTSTFTSSLSNFTKGALSESYLGEADGPLGSPHLDVVPRAGSRAGGGKAELGQDLLPGPAPGQRPQAGAGECPGSQHHSVLRLRSENHIEY